MNAVLQKTPFALKEIKTLQSLRSTLLLPIDKTNQAQHSVNNSNGNSGSGGAGSHFKSNLVSSMAAINLKSKEAAFPFVMGEHANVAGKITLEKNTASAEAMLSNILPKHTDIFVDSIGASGVDLISSSGDAIKSSPSVDYLSISPSFGPCSLSFDNQSFDETTPDEFAPINLLKGIANINYDFTFSDNSADNSISEDVDTQNRLAVASSSNRLNESESMSSFNLDEFDPLCNTETNDNITTMKTIPSAIPNKPTNISLVDAKPTTLIESEDSPNQVLLPSPLKPTATDYKGFSNSNIPTISCNTGDFSSLNYTANDEVASNNETSHQTDVEKN